MARFAIYLQPKPGITLTTTSHAPSHTCSAFTINSIVLNSSLTSPVESIITIVSNASNFFHFAYVAHRISLVLVISSIKVGLAHLGLASMFYILGPTQDRTSA